MINITFTPEMFEQKFCDRLRNISQKQLYFENQNVYNPSLRNEYGQLLDFCNKYKDILMGREHLLSTVQSVLKYNHRYINNLDSWKTVFSC